MNNIFDTEDISDLPAELVKELKLASDVDNILLTLFLEAGGVLDLSTLLVGYYRKHKEVKSRQYMMTTCYRLVKKGFLEPTDNKGEYGITEKGKAVIGAGKESVEERREERYNYEGELDEEEYEDEEEEYEE